MAIISAAVESNGWVLAIVVSGSAGGFSDYTLDPDVSPRVVVNSSHAGFVQSGGEAVSGTLARATPATIPLRLPVDPLDITPVIDEADLGSGQWLVRLALANFIYATDTGLTLDVLAGWRTGESAASGVSVTNNSTVAAPIPIMRWADLQLQVHTGIFRLALVVASHHPNGFQPVAGVKFTATDGTNTKTVWATALDTDPRHGDDLRCYTVEIDPATATALTAGLLRCDAEVYPWLGAMRSTDTAGTQSMANLQLVTRETPAARPLVIGYDPGSTRYGTQWVYVDPVNGTTTASSSMVAGSLAGAKAVAPASRPRNVNTAYQAIYLNNKTLAAANGGSSWTRSCDNARVVLAPGVSVFGTSAVTSGIQAVELPLIIMGDPDDSDPRANCILRSGTATPGFAGIFRVQLKDMTAEIGQATFMNTPGLIFMDNVEVRGKAGFETALTQLTSATPATGIYTISTINTRWWKTGLGMNTIQLRFALIRNCEFSRQARAVAILKSRWIEPLDTTIGPALAIGNFDVAADAGGGEDNFIAYNDLRELETRAVTISYVTAAAAGTTYQSLRRFVMIGNVFERVSNVADTQPFFAIGESVSVTASYNIVESNTFAGERVNAIYNDPNSGSDTINSQLIVNRWANNGFDWNPTKHDDFLNPTHGYRPWLIGGWATQNGVMAEGNYDATRHPASPAFSYRFFGLRSLAAGSSTSPGYTSDRSQYGNDAGGGDYRPASGSPLLGRVLNGNSDRDFAGAARISGGAAGAFEQDFLIIDPAAGRTVLRGSSPVVTAAADAAAAAGQIVMRGSQPSVSVSPGIGISPAAGRILMGASSPAAAAAAAAAAATGRIVMRSTSPAVDAVVSDDGLMPISLAQAKTVLREDLNERDDYIRALVRAAAVMVEDFCGVVVGPQRAIVISYPVFGERVIISKRPLVTVSNVVYDDVDGEEITLDAARWRVREFIGRPALVPAPGTDWPAVWAGYGTVRVTITAGYASRDEVPETLREAVKQIISHWYNAPEAAGSPLVEMPFGVRQMLSPFRRGLLG